jgi:polyphosphate kinase 2 (PPK2 family)
MVYLAIALGIALIVLVASNAVWLYFFLQISRDSARERWSLLERIRDPQAPMSKEDQSVLENWIANTEVEDEFDLTGRIDPATPLRSEDK